MDREKVIKELSELHGSKETMEIIEQAIALLKEQQEIVRCKDCKYWKDQNATSKWLPCIEMKTDKNWYCADGERGKGGEVEMRKLTFDGYVCGVTGLTCCGCSLFCQHRKVSSNDKEIENGKNIFQANMH